MKRMKVDKECETKEMKKVTKKTTLKMKEKPFDFLNLVQMS